MSKNQKNPFKVSETVLKKIKGGKRKARKARKGTALGGRKGDPSSHKGGRPD